MTGRSFFVLLLFFLLCGAALPAQQVDPALKEKADKVFQSAEETTMRINSGICRITRLNRTNDGSNWPYFNEPGEFRLIFDCAAGFVRFESGFFERELLTPEFFYTFTYDTKNRRAFSHNCPADEYETTGLAKRNAIDVRSFFLPGGMCHRALSGYGKSAFGRQTRDLAKVACEELPSGQIKITTFRDYGYPEDALVTEDYIIDPDRGYTVSHFEQKQELNISESFLFFFHHKTGFRMVTHRTHRVTWEQINDTWVPVSGVFNFIYDGDSSHHESETEWKIDWEQVNAPIDPSLFDPDAVLADLEATAPDHIEKDADEPAAGGRCPLRLSDAR